MTEQSPPDTFDVTVTLVPGSGGRLLSPQREYVIDCDTDEEIVAELTRMVESKRRMLGRWLEGR